MTLKTGLVAALEHNRTTIKCKKGKEISREYEIIW